MAYGTRTPEAQKGKRQELGRCLSPGCERSRSASARYGSSENWPTPQKEAYQDSGLSPEKGFKISGLRQGSQSKISSLRCFFLSLGIFWPSSDHMGSVSLLCLGFRKVLDLNRNRVADPGLEAANL